MLSDGEGEGHSTHKREDGKSVMLFRSSGSVISCAEVPDPFFMQSTPEIPSALANYEKTGNL